MEAHFHLSPLIEPIGRKPYLKKWVDHKSAQSAYGSKHLYNPFEDIYRFLFQMLEQDNLELAYKFRYIVEAVGSAPFIKRQDQLDRALKKAKNKAYEPLKKLLQKIQLELDLDSDFQAKPITKKKPVTKNSPNSSGEFGETILPFIPEISTPESTNYKIPLGLYGWNNRSHDTSDFNKEPPLAAETEMIPSDRLKNADIVQSKSNQVDKSNDTHADKNQLNQVVENLGGVSKAPVDNHIQEPLPSPKIKVQEKVGHVAENESPAKVDPFPSVTHTPILNKGALDTGTLQAKGNTEQHPEEEGLLEIKARPSIKSGPTENIKKRMSEPIDSPTIHDYAPETTWQEDTIKDFSALPTQSVDPDFEQEAKTPVKQILEKGKTGSSSEKLSDGLVKQESTLLPPDSSTLPIIGESLDQKSHSDDKRSLKETSMDSSTIKSKKPDKSSKEVKNELGNVSIKQDNHQFGETDGTTKRPQYFTKDSLLKNKKTSNIRSGPTEIVEERTPESIDSPAKQDFAPEAVWQDKTIKDFSPLPTQSADPGLEQEIKTPAKQIMQKGKADRASDKLSEGLAKQESTVLRSEASTPPKGKEPLDLKTLSNAKHPLKDISFDSPSLKSKKPAKLSKGETTERGNANASIEQDNHKFNEKDGATEQTQHYFENSDYLKALAAAQRRKSSTIHLKEEGHDTDNPSQHKSLVSASTPQGPSSADHFFVKSLKAPLSQQKEKETLKARDIRALNDISPEEEEDYPNLPATSKKKNSLPFNLRKNESPETKQAVLEETPESHQSSNGINYNLRGFKPPTATKQPEGEQESPNSDVAADSEKNNKKTEKETRQKATSLSNSSRQRQESIFRISQQAEARGFEEVQRSESDKKTTQTVSPLPSLYNFKFQLKKPKVSRPFKPYNDNTSLVISKDSIDRRIEMVVPKKHFLAGSTTWNYFKNKNYHRFYRDTTSLVIQKECIEHRILDINFPSKRALEIASAELETFKSLDVFYGESKNCDNNGSHSFDPASASNGSKVYSFHDSFISREKAKKIHKKKRKELYQKSLDWLNNKEGILFDYKTGKISIDNSDKHEIEKWVRSQQSESIEMYRAYAEAVMYPGLNHMKSIQEMVRSKLKNNDFPSQRVREIADRLKEKPGVGELSRDNLLDILKRQDYVSTNASILTPSISFSNSYSRYRAWRNTVKSPKIEVRGIDSSQRKSAFSFDAFQRRVSYADSPKINVRSSSDYQFKHTLHSFDKIFKRRKSQS